MLAISDAKITNELDRNLQARPIGRDGGEKRIFREWLATLIKCWFMQLEYRYILAWLLKTINDKDARCTLFLFL
jgi:hypothetical protein